jgi:hypothetical protein
VRALLALALLGALPAPAQAAAPTATQVLARARALGVGHEAQTLRGRFLPGARLLGGGSGALGSTRIGGRPDLAPGQGWPSCHGHRLAFLMQLSLAELQRAAPGQAGGTGVLSVFGDLREAPDGVTPIEEVSGRVRPGGCVAVLHGRGALVRRATPRRVKTLRNTPLRLRPTLTIPGWELAEQLLGGGQRADPFFDRWERLASEAAWGVLGHAPPYRPIHQLLGWSSPEQADPTRYCGSHRAADRLLLQLGYDEGVRFAVGDIGALYVTIAPGDLRRGRYDRLCAEFQEG